MPKNSFLVLCAALLNLACIPAFAQYGRPNLTKGVGIDQKLNAPVPLYVLFKDEQNRSVTLRSFTQNRPMILALVYYRCPSLCSVTLNEIITSLRRVTLEPGRDYNVVAVSIDPQETPELALSKKAAYASLFNRPTFASGVHFLTGSQSSISQLAEAVGFHYRWDDASKQFVHGAGFAVVTPSGHVSRYFFGVQYAPADLRMSLVDAARDQIGTPVDHLLLFCFHYDATQGKYTLAITNILKAAGLVTVLGLAILITYLTKSPSRPGEIRRLRNRVRAEARHV